MPVALSPPLPRPAHPVIRQALPFGILPVVSPTNSPTASTSNFYTAVTQGLYNASSVLSKGIYTLQTNTDSMSKLVTRLQTDLIGANSDTTTFHAFTGDGTGLSTSISSTNRKGVLGAMNQNLYYGFRTMFSGLGSINTSIGTLDGHLTTMSKNMDSNFTSLGKKLDTNYQGIVKVLAGYNTASQYQVLDTSVTGGFPMIHQWFSEFYDVLFDPLDEELKDKSEDQKAGGNG